MKSAQILLIALLTALLAACGGETADTELPGETVRPVVTITVPPPSHGRKRSFSGIARSAVETALSFRVAGEISELPVKVGDKVKAGDLIAKLDPTDYQLRVQQLQAELARVDASLRQAKAVYQRTRQLYEVQNATKSDLDAAQANYDSSRALRAATAKSLELARKQVEYTRLVAPLDGNIAVVPVEVHQTINVGTPIATLSAGEKIEMQIGVPEQIINRIKPSDPAVITFDSLPNREFQANVIEVGVEPGESAAYPVKLKLITANPEVKSGMVGQATIAFDPAPGKNFVLIPTEAVVGEYGDRKSVWVVDSKKGVVSKRTVEVGDLTSDGLQILSGLNPGEIIVTRGVNRLEEGMKVRLMESSNHLGGL